MPLVRFSYYALALGWAILILIGTLMPAPALPPIPQWDLLSFDTFAHAVLFGGQLLLLLFGFKRDPSVTLSSSLITYSFLAVVAYGVLVEILQGSMGLGRAMDPVDAVSNTIGCFLGLLLWFLVARRF
jgi:VanZ family protein